ncbi:MAG: ParB/RepB/Spo0J family partition protein [Eubacteriales bacterium]|nr:ParB/RepB/Spo0J family partition protein [Eubacteriales bacterium]
MARVNDNSKVDSAKATSKNRNDVKNSSSSNIKNVSAKAPAKNKGLGKGLGALLQTVDIPDDKIQDAVMELKITDINPNSEQPRKRFDKDKLEDLAASIKENGIIQPIIVCRNQEGEGYRIVAGERRWRASRLAGLKLIPAIVRDLTDLQVLEHALIENIQRQDLNPIEEADALDKLIKEHKITQEKLAAVVGRSRPAIANTLRLLNLPDTVKKYVMNEDISAGHARAILAIRDQEIQIKAAEMVIEKDLSVRETEKLVKKLEKEPKQKSKQQMSEAYILSIKNVENELARSLGTKVHLKDRQGKGSIVIDYFSSEDLERLIDILK